MITLKTYLRPSSRAYLRTKWSTEKHLSSKSVSLYFCWRFEMFQVSLNFNQDILILCFGFWPGGVAGGWGFQNVFLALEFYISVTSLYTAWIYYTFCLVRKNMFEVSTFTVFFVIRFWNWFTSSFFIVKWKKCMLLFFYLDAHTRSAGIRILLLR